MILEGFLGAFSGILGNAITNYLNLRQQKLKNEHELKMVEAETKAMIAEKDANIRVSEMELAQEMERVDADIYKESQKQGNKKALDDKILEKLFESNWTKPVGVFLSFVFGVVDAFRKSMRPALTAYSIGLATWLTYQAVQIIEAKQDLVTVAMATEIFQSSMETIFYMAITAFFWWFGDRRNAKYAYRLNDGNYRNK